MRTLPNARTVRRPEAVESPGRRRARQQDALSLTSVPLAITPVRLSTVQNAVYDQLLNALLSGRISPGEKLTIESIATLMGVSLTPVRVALQKLQADNFIVIGKNRRITVTELSSANVLELLQVRLMLECHAAEMACAKRSEAALDELASANRKCEEAKDPDSYLAANQQFHSILYSQANMPMLAEVIHVLWNRASPYLHILLRSEEYFSAAEFNENHRGMVAALERRNAKAMRRWLTRDLTEAAKLVERRLATKRSSGL